MKTDFRSLKCFCVLFALTFGYGLVSAATDAERLSQLKIDSVQIEFDDALGKNENYVSAIGKVLNPSDAVAFDIVVEAKFFNAEKKLTDVVTRQIARISIPAGKDVFIKLGDSTGKLKSNYLRAEMRVVSAEFKLPRESPAKMEKSLLWEVFINLGPMLILIGAWGVFIWLQSGKSSPQQRLVVLMQEQNVMVNRLAVAAEKMADDVRSKSD